MAMPAFRDDGWLPTGHFTATWDEITRHFGSEIGSRRAMVLANLLRWRNAAHTVGLAGLVILDGSFTSSKEEPGDFDLMFLYDDASETLLKHDQKARELTDYQFCRTQYNGDVFALPISLQRSAPVLAGLDMFDFDRQGRPKGVVEVIV